MKARNLFLPVCLTALVLLSAGCKKKSFIPSGPVNFVISSQLPATKTAYSGETVEGRERIDWIDEDKIAIFMAYVSENSDQEVDGYDILDYTVSDISASGAKSIAKISPVDEPHFWQDNDEGDLWYVFAALYPSPSVDDSWANEIDLNKLVLTWPAVQTLTPKGDSGADALTLLPDMKYAYMFAFPDSPTKRTGSPISLSLSPVFTAFEVSISAGDNDEINLTQFRLLSNNEDQPLARVMDLYSDVSSDESTSITVDLTGIKLTRDGDPLTLTVFAYADSFSALSLEFTGDEIGTRKLDLKDGGEWISFHALYKHRIKGLYFPALDEGTASGQDINWGGMSGEDLGWNGADGEDINWRN